MEVALIIGMFVSTTLSLNYLVSKNHKLSGMFDVINLCLIVAVAYQFDQVKNIMWVLVVAAIIVIGLFILKTYMTVKKSRPVDVDVIENKEEK